MAIKLVQKIPLNAVEVISSQDDALDLAASDFTAYQRTLDKAHLKFVPDKQPTIFLCNFDFKGKEAERLKNAMMSARDDDGNPSLAAGSWSMRVVKFALKDIKNPDYLATDESITFRKDQDGYAHDDTVAILERVGIVNEIFVGYYLPLVKLGGRDDAKNS